jgi:hypothetical protein
MLWMAPAPASVFRHSLGDIIQIKGATMSELATVGIDLAKCVFQIHGVDENGLVVVRSPASPQPITCIFPEAP